MGERGRGFESWEKHPHFGTSAFLALVALRWPLYLLGDLLSQHSS